MFLSLFLISALVVNVASVQSVVDCQNEASIILKIREELLPLQQYCVVSETATVYEFIDKCKTNNYCKRAAELAWDIYTVIKTCGHDIENSADVKAAYTGCTGKQAIEPTAQTTQTTQNKDSAAISTAISFGAIILAVTAFLMN